MLQKEPLVSVIVPMFNAESEVERSIQSVLNQKYENIELLLIDDGSYDRTQEICEQYVCKFEFVKYYKQENSGPGSARNYGIDMSNGD